MEFLRLKFNEKSFQSKKRKRKPWIACSKWGCSFVSIWRIFFVMRSKGPGRFNSCVFKWSARRARLRACSAFCKLGAHWESCKIPLDISWLRSGRWDSFSFKTSEQFKIECGVFTSSSLRFKFKLDIFVFF